MSKYDPKEVGTSGLKRYNGIINEEFVNELRGQRKIKIYDEMMSNDAIVGGVMFAIENIVSQVKFRVDAGVDSEEGKNQAEFIYDCMNDMSSSWSESISDFISFIGYGFGYHEIVYKRRLGPNAKDASMRSKFNDGKIGWRKIPGRAQETLVDNWVFDENGGIQGVIQKAPPEYTERFLPVEKSLLFRTSTRKANPEGKSILRSAYRSWYIKKNIQNLEAVGLERDLAGLPVLYVPPSVLSGTTAEDKLRRKEYEDIITNIRRDEQEGVLLPAVYDQAGHKLYELTLLSSGGQRNFNTSEIIRRYDSDIALSVLADFILLGTQNVGSFALSKEKINIFSLAVTGFVDHICEIMNRHAVPRLLTLNGESLDYQPKIVHSGVKSVDLQALGAYISTLSSSGMQLFPDENLENHLLKVASLPTKGEANQ